MFPPGAAFLTGLLLAAAFVRADELLYAYEGDVLPYHPSGGWIIADACGGQDACSEHLGDGVFALEWSIFGDFANYDLDLGTPSSPPPEPPFWVEWRYASLKPLGTNQGADGAFWVDYRNVGNLLYIFGDAVVSEDAGTVRGGFAIGQFRTDRLETPDDGSHCVFVNGRLFICGGPRPDDGYSSLQFRGRGPIAIGQFNRNSWDYIRYGRITYGEKIIASDPPAGFLDARGHAGLDRFLVRYDSPNYVLIDEITVSVEGTKGLRDEGTEDRTVAHQKVGTFSPFDAPVVTATGRRDYGPPDEVEIVLDRAIPFRATTRFTFDDGTAVNVVEFTFAPGDTDGDGDADLADFSYLQNCTGDSDEATEPRGGGFAGPCLALDADADSAIDLPDHADFLTHFAGP